VRSSPPSTSTVFFFLLLVLPVYLFAPALESLGVGCSNLSLFFAFVSVWWFFGKCGVSLTGLKVPLSFSPLTPFLLLTAFAFFFLWVLLDLVATLLLEWLLLFLCFSWSSHSPLGCTHTHTHTCISANTLDLSDRRGGRKHTVCMCVWMCVCACSSSPCATGMGVHLPPAARSRFLTFFSFLCRCCSGCCDMLFWAG
jgi:hypothetical protein